MSDPVTEVQWNKIHEGVKTVSSNARFKLTQYNYVHQVYLTPKRLHTIYSDRNLACPRCGETVADFIHMTWACPVIDEYWRLVIEKLSQLTEWNIPLEMKVILLGLLPSPKQKKLTRKFIMLGLVLAKRRIAIRWLSKNPPRIEDWLRDMIEWSIAEEVHMKKIRKDDKRETDILAWGTLVEALNIQGGPESTGEAERAEQ